MDLMSNMDVTVGGDDDVCRKKKVWDCMKPEDGCYWDSARGCREARDDEKSMYETAKNLFHPLYSRMPEPSVTKENEKIKRDVQVEIVPRPRRDVFAQSMKAPSKRKKSKKTSKKKTSRRRR